MFMDFSDTTIRARPKRRGGSRGGAAGRGRGKAPSKPKGPSKTIRIEEESSDFHHESISRAFIIALQQARQAKGWDQKKLAQYLSVKVSVVNQYESGKAIPNQALINMMNRVLETRLPPVTSRSGKRKRRRKKPSAAAGGKGRGRGRSTRGRGRGRGSRGRGRGRARGRGVRRGGGGGVHGLSLRGRV